MLWPSLLVTPWHSCFFKGVCSTDSFLSPYFLRISTVWSRLHHISVGRVQSKELNYFMFTYTFLAFCFVLIFYRYFFAVFHRQYYVFIIFISLYEVSSFRNRRLTNQKPTLEIRNCQWNCMKKKTLIKLIF